MTTDTVSGAEMQNLWIVSCLQTLGLEKIFLEERLELIEGSEPLVGRYISLRLAVASIPIASLRERLVLLQRHW